MTMTLEKEDEVDTALAINHIRRIVNDFTSPQSLVLLL